jgi:type I restriction enzyme, S subunit
MGSEWRLVSFGDLYAEPSRNGLTKPKKVRGEGVKFVNMGEIFAHDRMSSISCDRAPLTEKESLASLLKPLDLLFARQSLVLSGAGKCSLFMGDTEPVAFESHLIRVRLEQTKVVPEFFYYFFKSPLGKDSIYSIVEQGAGASGVRGSDLANLNVPLPPLPEQKAIAHVLGTLDDRIELNRRMNETLEAMAQALFKSWFVDFDPVIDNALASGKEIPAELSERAAVRAALGDKRQPLPAEIRTLFPNEFTDSAELGWIPKGWEVKTFNQFIELIGGGTPKTSVEEYWGGDIPWFSVVDAPSLANVFVIDTEKHVTQLGVDNSSTKILPIGATIISARGTVGKCAIVGRPMAINQSCYGVRGKKGISDCFVYYSIREQVEHLQRGGHGSVFNTITRDTFKIIKMAIGKTEFTKKFEACIKPFLDKILANNIQNIDLSKLRDTLLPKLLSGELRIPEAEKMVEELAL